MELSPQQFVTLVLVAFLERTVQTTVTLLYLHHSSFFSPLFFLWRKLFLAKQKWGGRQPNAPVLAAAE